MSQKSFFIIALGLASVLAPSIVRAEAAFENRPRIVVQSSATVRGPDVLLGEVAVISATEPEYNKLVEDLKAIKICESPPPRTKIGIPGGKILALIEGLGISSDTVAYSIPQVIQVERAGRVIGTEDILSDVRTLLSRDNSLDVQVREVHWDTAQTIPLGATDFEIERLGEPSSGKVPLRVLAKVDGLPAARFMATAIVDDWREVPVLKKTLERGMLISPVDVELVRLNMFKQPQDVADSLDDVLGRAVKSRMTAGETLRKSLIDIPPLVPQGKRVTLLYRVGALRASATGVSLDNGLRGDIVRVRNESSKKVVRGKIINESELEVELQ